MADKTKGLSEKVCSLCGRTIEPRKKWLANWDEIKYCSEKCRRSKNSPQYDDALMELLKKRGAGKTICPSEILTEDLKQNKDIMEQVRQAARRLVAKNKIEITQNGQIVDPSSAKGPIRLRLITRSIR